MTEKEASYEVDDALEMLGTGYEPPAFEIEKPSTVIQRRDGKTELIDRPAFVKISTAFKSELKNISGDALKVWLFISLSINRKTGKANPSLRTISEDVGLAVNTVQKVLLELESLELLVVDRQSRRYNLYESPEFVSANRSEPVSNRDTDGETVSNSEETVSNSEKTVSRPREDFLLNQRNQSNQIYGENVKNSKKPLTKQDMEEIKESANRMIDGWLSFEQLGYGKVKSWKYRHIFEFDDKVVDLADVLVMKFWEPSKAETFIWLQDIANLIRNGVTPKILIEAIDEANEKWNVKPTRLTDGVMNLARTKVKTQSRPVRSAEKPRLLGAEKRE